MLKISTLSVLAFALIQAGALEAQANARASASRSGAQLPDGAGRDVTQKVCGSTCHGPDTVMGGGRTRDQWTAVVNSMVARGAKATEPELAQIIGYLNQNFGPNYNPASVRETAGAPESRPARGAVGKGPGPLGAGAADSHVVDNAAADRGKGVFIAECASCHGMRGRGGNQALPASQRGPDLVRSLIILRDRYGSDLGPYLAKGHKMRSGKSSTTLSKEQVGDITNFLHQRVFYTLRTGPELEVMNVLTGDAKAGAAYFNGDGKCSSCHSPSGDLKGIGTRYDPPTMQGKFLFPRTVAFGSRAPAKSTSKPVTVTVSLPSGEKVEGVVEKLDDFNVSLRDAEGEYRAFPITPDVKVEEHDPLAAHITMLDQYTDQNIHDIVAYLETLK